MKKISLLLLPLLLLTSCTGIDNRSKQLEFEGVTFANKTYTYDANPHILDEVKGAPIDTIITYEGRESHTDVGEYLARATLSKEGYITKTLEATLKINPASLTGIVFQDASFEYDGQPHSLECKNVPEGATVTYLNNSRTEMGSQRVKATITKDNYNVKELYATLTITGKIIRGVTFEDTSFEYDGWPHYIYVTGDLPEGVKVNYSNNYRTAIGTQTAYAVLVGTGYETLDLTAKLTITNRTIKGVEFNDTTRFYSGKEYGIYVEGSLPSGAKVTYTNNTRTNPGTQTAKAVISCSGYQTLTLTATLTILEFDLIQIITTTEDEAFKITENIKYEELKEELFKGNFSMMHEFGYKRGYLDTDEIYEEGLLSRYHYAVTNNAYFKHYDDLDEGSIPFDDDTANYVKIAGDYSLRKELYLESFSSYFYKAPKESFEETYIEYNAAEPFYILGKDEDGNFIPSIFNDGYYYHTTTFEIDTENNTFTIYWQTNSVKTDQIFHQTYKTVFFNIGNTKINVPDYLDPKLEDVETYPTDDFTYDGVSYAYLTDGWEANITIREQELVFVEKGAHTVLPMIYGNPIVRLRLMSSTAQNNYDYSGYELNVYFSEDLYYQGEYENIYLDSDGNPKKIYTQSKYFGPDTSMYRYEDYGGVIHYYGQW